MTATMLRILEHLRNSSRTGRATPCVVVWAHNSHVADALATSMSRYEEWNLGQMMRQTLGQESCFVLAFSTFTGMSVESNTLSSVVDTCLPSFVRVSLVRAHTHSRPPCHATRSGTSGR